MRKILFTIALIMVAMIAPAQEKPMEGLCFNPDKPAEFPGGKVAMGQYFSENLEYPTDALIEGIEGRVMCQFIIQPDSSRTNINIVRKVHPSIDAEMRRLVENMPQWTPATKDSIPVKTLVTLPLMFKLPENLRIVTENVSVFYDGKRYISSIRKTEKDSSYDVKIESEESLIDSIQMYITENIASKYKSLDTILSCQFTLNADTTISNLKLYPIHSIKNILSNRYRYRRPYTGITNILFKDGNIKITEFDNLTNTTSISTMALSQDYQDIQYNPIYQCISTDKNKLEEFILSEDIRKTIELDIKNLPKNLFIPFIKKAELYKEDNKIITPQVTYHCNLFCKDIEKNFSSPLSEKNQFILTMKPTYHVKGKDLDDFVVERCNNTAWFGKDGVAKIKFVVHKDGKLSSFEILENSNKEVAQNVISIIKETEKQWTPGIYKNQYVDCEYIYTISLVKTNQTHNVVLNQKNEIIKIGNLSYEIKKHKKTAIAKGKNYKKTEVVIPAEITHDSIIYKVVEVDGFFLNKNLKKVIISEGISKIGFGAFSECTSLESITIPNSVTLIDGDAFSGCKSLESIILPNCLEKIYQRAFNGCTSLKSIIIPDSVTYFYNYITVNKSLTKTEISKTQGIFSDCTSLQEIKFSNNQINIPPFMFKNCTALKSITIPENITKIESYAFVNCTALEKIKLHNSLCVETNAFTNTAWYNSQPEGFVYLDNILLGYKGNKSKVTHINIKEGTKILANHIFADFQNLISVTIPESVEIIGDNAFENCTSLEKIVIPKNVKIIGSKALKGCTSLREVKILSDNITSIQPETFCDCPLMESIILSESVTNIGNGVFKNCKSITKITIPAKVTEIGYHTFNGCSSLKTIEFKSIIPPKMQSSKFETEVQLIIPAGSEAAYQEAFNSK